MLAIKNTSSRHIPEFSPFNLMLYCIEILDPPLATSVGYKDGVCGAHSKRKLMSQYWSIQKPYHKASKCQKQTFYLRCHTFQGVEEGV